VAGKGSGIVVGLEVEGIVCFTVDWIPAVGMLDELIAGLAVPLQLQHVKINKRAKMFWRSLCIDTVMFKLCAK
jgi:hypothetical protein